MNRLEKVHKKFMVLSARAAKAEKAYSEAVKEEARAKKKTEKAENHAQDIEYDLNALLDSYALYEVLEGFRVGVMLDAEEPDKSRVDIWSPDKEDPACSITWKQMLFLRTLLANVINGGES